MTKNICTKKVFMIFVPHEDDEINTTGELIYQALKKGMKVGVVFTTNGDFKYKANTRISEALNAVHLLNKDANCIFLGYGDTFNNSITKHLFYAENCIKSPSGHRNTYGISNVEDFAFQTFGKHHSYTRKSYENDVYQVIVKIRPDFIISVDYDVHSDHRMASIVFEQSIDKILKQYNSLNYRPIVYKSFAYTTGFHAISDFYSLNLLETKIPTENKVIHYHKDWDLVNSSIYDWKKRIRIPLSRIDTGHYLSHNLIFRALCQHRSQSAGLHACQIINSDKVFWQRRTDSCSYYAQITVSSNFADAHYLNDFQLYNTDDIDSEIPVFNHYAWIPDENDVEKKITFTWDDYQEVQRIVLYGLLDQEVHIQQVEIEFDNGEKVVAGPLPGKGIPLSVTLIKPLWIKWCSIKILQFDGKGGFAECEFFATEWQKNNPIKPFIKILDQDNFIYDYLVPTTTNQLQLRIYYFECQGTVTFKIIGNSYGAKITEDGKLYLDQLTNKITVKAYLNDYPDIQDTITVRKVRQWEIKKIHFLQQVERLFLTFLLRLNRKYIYLRKKYINDI